MSDKVLGVDLGLSSTLPLHEVNNRYIGADGRTYRYVRAGAAIALGDSLKQDTAEELYALDPISAVGQTVLGCWPNENPYAGTARAAIADNAYFWAVVGGDALVKAAAVVAGSVPITTGTAGTLDDVVATAATAAQAAEIASSILAVWLTVDSGGFARVRLGKG